MKSDSQKNLARYLFIELGLSDPQELAERSGAELHSILTWIQDEHWKEFRELKHLFLQMEDIFKRLL